MELPEELFPDEPRPDETDVEPPWSLGHDGRAIAGMRRERRKRERERKKGRDCDHKSNKEKKKKLVSLCQMSDDDFIDVAATMASGSIGGSASGDGALRALSGSLHGGGAGGGRMSTATTTTSTSSQHLDRQSSPPAPASSSRRGWFSSLFGGAGAAIPAAVQAARSKTVSRLDRERIEREERD